MKMENDGTWGTDAEMFAFATITNTIVYVYCCSGRNKDIDEYSWLPYKPVSDGVPEEKAVNLSNIGGNHFGPVLDLDGHEYSRQPFKRIGDYIPTIYHHLVLKDIILYI